MYTFTFIKKEKQQVGVGVLRKKCTENSSSTPGTSIERNEVVFLEPVTSTLPLNIQEDLSELEHQFKEGDLTEKGYHKRRSILLIPYLIPYHDPKEAVESNNGTVIEPELESLPKAVVEELKKLQEELRNEEITEKGFNKRRTNILAPYMLKEPARNELPSGIQQEYSSLEAEYKEGDITDKGFKRKKMKLLKPYLVAVNPTSYNVPVKQKDSPQKGKKTEQVVIGIQSVMNDGQKCFKCGVCGEVFKQAHSFSGHCRIHRAERVKHFKCSICNAAYSTRSHLKFHMYKHTGNFPFTCRYCGKGFAGRSQHKSHESRHTGESPYPCKQCGARFWKKENYQLHITTSCLQKDWTPGGVTPEHTENRKTTWTPSVTPNVTEEHSDNRKTVAQNCSQSFDAGADMSDELHMQDLSHMHMSTINLQDVKYSPVSNSRENLLTTPTIGVVTSLDTKQDIALPAAVRFNVDNRTGGGKFKVGI